MIGDAVLEPEDFESAEEPQGVESDQFYAVGHLIEGMAFYRCEQKGQPVFTGRLNNALLFYTHEEAQQWAEEQQRPRSFGTDLLIFRIETKSVPLKRVRPSTTAKEESHVLPEVS